jgi:hypothetical protein
VKVKTLFVALMLATTFVFGQDVKANLVILRNEKLVIEEISAFRFTVIKNNLVTSVSADYIPGELRLTREDFDRLVSDSVATIQLRFDLNSFRGSRHHILNVNTDFKTGLFQQEYLILNVFDFCDKKYKKRFGYLTKGDFISEFSFPGSGTRLVAKE